MIETLLSEAPLFQSLEDPRLAQRVAGLLERRSVEEGEDIFRTGDAPDALFLIESGSVALFTEEPGAPMSVVARLDAGCLFGEVGVLDDSVRAVSARALEPTVLRSLSRDEVRALARESREFGVALVLFAMSGREREPHARAELGERATPRVRVDRTVYLWPDGGRPTTVRLENLSTGGTRLVGVPESWQKGSEVAFSLEIDPAHQVLRARGRVVWRLGEAAGIAFGDTDAAHRERVQRALDRLLAPAG